jgi:hypothetical protein
MAEAAGEAVAVSVHAAFHFEGAEAVAEASGQQGEDPEGGFGDGAQVAHLSSNANSGEVRRSVVNQSWSVDFGTEVAAARCRQSRPSQPGTRANTCF